MTELTASLQGLPAFLRYLPWFDGQYALVGSWIVGDTACGNGLREDATLITRNTSRFVPHVILP